MSGATIQSLYVPQQGAISDLAGWISGDLGGALARLYSSNTPFVPTRVCGDYTEASFVGYAPATPLAWTAPFINGSGKAESDSAALTWTFTGASGSYPVYGIYLTDPGQTKLLAVIPFLVPFNFDGSHLTLAYQIQMTEVSEL